MGNRPPRSKLMMTALVLTTVAVIAVVAVYAGEWWTMAQYPDDFPNRPETDRGFRIAKVYWMTVGSPLLLLGAASWFLGLFFYAYAGLSRRAYFSVSIGRWCSVLHVMLGTYVLWIFVRAI